MRVQKGAGGVPSKPESNEEQIYLDYAYRNLSNEQLTELLSVYTDSQLSNIYRLVVAANNLTILPTLPRRLLELYCENNQLTLLPELPYRLQSLHCENNQLTVLPELPRGLLELICTNNNLTNLPALPYGFVRLFCGNNQLTNLPTLPHRLIELDSSYNQLRILPLLPLGLKWVNFRGNPLHEPFSTFIDIYNENNNIDLLIRNVNNYYEIKHRGKNLAAFQKTFGAYETAAGLFGPNKIKGRFENTPHIPNGPASVIGEFLTGKKEH